MARVLVTGANGFLGSHLCDAFVEAGHEVHGLVRPTSDLRFVDRARVRLVVGDLTRAAEIDFPSEMDVVVHAAALVSDNASLRDCEEHVYGITVHLADEAARRWPRLARFIYISSALTLGYCADGISEARPGRSAMYVPYNRMKKRAEEYLLERHRASGLPVVILRPGDAYGPRDRTTSVKLLEALERGVLLRVGSGRHHFGLCAPVNLCRAALAAMDRPGVVGRAYTVVNTVAPTWREFFDILQQEMGRPQRLYQPVTLGMSVALLFEAVKCLVPGFTPPLNYYRMRRITSQTTYDMSQTLADLGYESDEDYRALFRSIVAWYRRQWRGGAT